jgi:hypothetical protein
MKPSTRDGNSFAISMQDSVKSLADCCCSDESTIARTCLFVVVAVDDGKMLAHTGTLTLKVQTLDFRL